MRGLAFLLALLLATAGCLDNDEGPADTDGDGFTDAEEAEAGTDPEDAMSTPTDEGIMETQLVEQSFTGSWATDDPRCAPGGSAGAEGVSYTTMDVSDGTQGQGFFAVFGATGGLLELRIEWHDAAGAVLHTDSDVDGGEFYEIKDRVPADAATAHFYSCGGPSEVSYSTPA